MATAQSFINDKLESLKAALVVTLVTGWLLSLVGTPLTVWQAVFH
jgi:hypothetical protein